MDIGNAVKMLRMKKVFPKKIYLPCVEFPLTHYVVLNQEILSLQKTQSQKCVRLWIFQILIYYCLAFQKKIFLKTRGFCIKHYVNL